MGTRKMKNKNENWAHWKWKLKMKTGHTENENDVVPLGKSLTTLQSWTLGEKKRYMRALGVQSSLGKYNGPV